MKLKHLSMELEYFTPKIMKLKHLSTELEYFTPKMTNFGPIQLGIIAYIGI